MIPRPTRSVSDSWMEVGYAQLPRGHHGEVDFDLVVDGSVQRGLVAKVKQAAGSSFADSLKVQWPARCLGRLPYRGFRDCVDGYVGQQVASRIVGDSRPLHRSIRVHHLRLRAEGACNVAVGVS